MHRRSQLGTAGLYASLPRAPAKIDDAAKNFSFREDLPNIYEIHLDELQSDYALKAIRDLGLESELSGFTFFENNISNYPYTQASLASYLKGSIFKAGDFNEWLHSFDQGQIRDLKALGYWIETIGFWNHVKTPLANSFRSDQEITNEVTAQKHPALGDFMKLWLAKVLPNFLTNEAQLWGEKLGKVTSEAVEENLAKDVPESIHLGRLQFNAVTAFRQLTEREESKNSAGRYFLIQALVSHAPYVLDADCRLRQIQKPSNSREDYILQNSCAVSMLAKFLRTLKVLGRYDNSVIVVISDHGSGWNGYRSSPPDSEPPPHVGPPSFQDVPVFQGSIGKFSPRGMATLMIKPSKASGPFAISGVKTQLIDVYPTIMELVDHVPGSSVDGLSLKPCLIDGDCKKFEGRPQDFYVYPIESLGTPLYKNRMQFVNGHAYIVDTQKVDSQD